MTPTAATAAPAPARTAACASPAANSTTKGLYHFGARYYQPSSARWTQPDPINHIADLRQANRYSYVGGDPVSLTDPLVLARICKPGYKLYVTVGGMTMCSKGEMPKTEKTIAQCAGAAAIGSIAGHREPSLGRSAVRG